MINSLKRITFNTKLGVDSETLAVIAYCIFVTSLILNATQFKYISVWGITNTIFKSFAIIFLALSFLLLKKLKLIVIILAIVVSIVFLQTNYLNAPFFISAFFFAGMHLYSNRLLKGYVVTTSAVVLFTLLMYFSGIYQYDTLEEGFRFRLYMGFTYVTFLANFFFHIILAWVAIKQRNITISETAVILVLNQLIMNWTDTKAVYYEIILLLAILWIFRFGKCIFKGKIFKWFMILNMPFFAMLSIFLSATYNPANGLYAWLNRLFTSRFSLGYEAIKIYGFNLFGNRISWVTGRYGIDRVENYFFVDSSYLQIALLYGLIVLCLVVIGFVYLSKKAFVEKKYMLCIALAFLSLHSFSDPQLLDLAYDPFLLIMGAAILRTGKLPGPREAL